jgi:alpha-glucosidase
MYFSEEHYITKSGKYGLSIRYSNAGGKKESAELSVNGVKKTITLIPTVNKETFTEIPVSFVLPDGKQKITISVPEKCKKSHASSDAVCISSVKLFEIYEACDAGFSGSMTKEQCLGNLPGFTHEGDGIKFKVFAGKAGTYALRIRYGAGNTNSEPQSVTLAINKEKQRLLLASLRTLDIRSDFTMNVRLKKGANNISFVKEKDDTGNLIIDFIGIIPSTPCYVGNVRSVKGLGTSKVVFSCDNADVLISSVSGNAVKIFADPERSFRTTYDSFTVINENVAPEAFEVSETGRSYTLSLSKIRIKINKTPFFVTFKDSENNVIMQNKPSSMGWTPSGECFVNNRILPGERFYGLGEKLNGFEHTGQKEQMWAVDAYGAANDSSVPAWENGKWYMSNPYYVSSAGYSVLFDNSSFTEFDLGASRKDTCTFKSSNPNPGGKLIYYFIYGPSFKTVTKTYTDMAGKSFFAPRWAYGNIQCHYGYKQEDIERVAETYRKLSIPIDVILSDIEWYEYLCAPTLFNKKNYPDPDGMIKKLRDLHIRYGLINDPNITDRDDNAFYRYGEEHGFFVKDVSGHTRQITWPWGGPSGLVDFFDPKAAAWWGTLLDGIIKQGVSCMWLDMNEPAKYNPDWYFRNEEGRPYGTFNEVKNAYAIMHQKAVFDKMTENGKRAFLQTRSGYSGTHRYASPWTGDIQGTCRSMHEQIILGTGLSLTGYNYWGFDIGGFFTTITSTQYKRWVELATFTPVHRFHYCEGVEEKEPWTHDALEVSKKYINLRYRLIPYMYSFAADSIIGTGLEGKADENGTGLPLVRPMLMEFQDDQNTYGTDTQFMCGTAFLVAPVLDDSEEKKVYLPKGRWYDINDPSSVYEGGRHIVYHAPFDVLPVFVKEGSIVPLQSERQYMDDPAASDTLTVRIYPTAGDSENSFVLYEDDGTSDAYKQGVYALTRVDCSVMNAAGDCAICISVSERSGKYKKIPKRDVVFEVQLQGRETALVSIGNRDLAEHSKDKLAQTDEGFSFDRKTQLCTIKTKDTGDAFKIMLLTR